MKTKIWNPNNVHNDVEFAAWMTQRQKIWDGKLYIKNDPNIPRHRVSYEMALREAERVDREREPDEDEILCVECMSLAFLRSIQK